MLFKQRYDFLSNFYFVEILYKGIVYPSVEHAFQGAKNHDRHYKRRIVNVGAPTTAKMLGRRCELRPDWDDVKIDIMTELIRIKFTDSVLKAQLLDTGDIPIIEHNTWGDTFWGKSVEGNIGENYLGIILEKVRNELTKMRL